MDNTILNVRFGAYHFQVIRLSDWKGEFQMRRSPITFRYNQYQAMCRIEDPKWKWFEWY